MVPPGERSRAFAGRYRLVAFVGEGAHAWVYAAEDLTLQRQVALKILKDSAASDERFLERFATEMRATSALHHPRVLPVYDWSTDPQPYMVTELLTGGSLAEIAASGKRLTPSQALVVGLEATRALVNIHAGGRAHLGLSASSILFDSGSRPYISDLGLSAALRSDTQDAHGDDDERGPERSQHHTGDLQADQHPPGLPPAGYSPDEQARDVHDLALTLCEAVTGSPARLADDGSVTMLVGSLGPLAPVLERATVTDPAGHMSAKGFAAELLRAAALLPRPDPLPLAVHEPPPEAGSAPDSFEQVGPPVGARSSIPLDDVLRRRWPGLLLAALVVLAGAAGAVWAWLGDDLASVPSLEGQSTSDAQAVAEANRWELNEFLVRQAGTRRGEIVRTEPEAGGELAAGSTLDVYVSLGEPLVRLADLASVYGLSLDDADLELESAGLQAAGTTSVHDEVVPPGYVVGLDVGATVYELELGSDVRLLVSAGPPDRVVPPVPTSLDPDVAGEVLASLRLVPRQVMVFSEEIPTGTVIGFYPTSGTSVPVDSTVQVRISRGPLQLPQPEIADDGADELDPSDAAAADEDPQ